MAGAAPALPRLEHPWISGLADRLYWISYPESDDGRLIDSYIRELQRFYRELDRPVGWILDCSHIRRATTAQLRQLAQHDHDLNELHQKYTAGMAFVIPGPFARGLLRAVYLFSPPVYPRALCRTGDEARHWIDGQLGQRRWAA